MNETIDEIKDWLAGSILAKLVGFVILFYTVNTIIWGLVEPLSMGYKFPNYYPIYHYSFASVLTFIGMYFLLKKKTIKTFNFQSLNTNDSDSWVTKQGTPIREVDKEGFLGKYISFNGGFHDQSQLKLDGVASTGDTLSLVYNPKEDFVFYVEITMSNKKGGQSQNGWFALFYNLRAPNYVSDLEWSYPIKYKVIENTWLSAKVNLTQATKKTFGKKGWQYDHIVGIKIRGTGFLHEISIS